MELQGRETQQAGSICTLRALSHFILKKEMLELKTPKEVACSLAHTGQAIFSDST